MPKLLFSLFLSSTVFANVPCSGTLSDFDHDTITLQSFQIYYCLGCQDSDDGSFDFDWYPYQLPPMDFDLLPTIIEE